MRCGILLNQQSLDGLHSLQPKRVTFQPPRVRILKAFKRTQLILMWLEEYDQRQLIPLSPILRRILEYLGLYITLYTTLLGNSS
jgi:hypothetical protein